MAPMQIHRLDQPTGGLVMAAKSRPALSALSAAFSQREVKKTYLALVGGRCPLLPVQLLPSAALACLSRGHLHAALSLQVLGT